MRRFMGWFGLMSFGLLLMASVVACTPKEEDVDEVDAPVADDMGDMDMGDM